MIGYWSSGYKEVLLKVKDKIILTPRRDEKPQIINILSIPLEEPKGVGQV